MNSPSVVHDECASGLMPCCRTKNAAGISRGICESVVPSRLRTRDDAASASLRHFSFLTLRPHTLTLLSPVPPTTPIARPTSPPHPLRVPSSPQPPLYLCRSHHFSPSLDPSPSYKSFSSLVDRAWAKSITARR